MRVPESRRRPLLPHDAAGLAALHERCFPLPWSAEAFETAFHVPGTFGFIFEPADAFILCRAAAEECEILTLCSAPQARRHGLASRLLEAAMAEAGRRAALAMFLEVAASNLPARTLYQRFGFEESGRRKGYYPTPGGQREDAVMMRARLS